MNRLKQSWSQFTAGWRHFWSAFVQGTDFFLGFVAAAIVCEAVYAVVSTIAVAVWPFLKETAVLLDVMPNFLWFVFGFAVSALLMLALVSWAGYQLRITQPNEKVR